MNPAQAQSGNFGLTINQRVGSPISMFNQQVTSIFQNLRVAIPAVVKSFSPGPPATVSATIAVHESVQWNVNGPQGPLDLKLEQMTPGNMNADQAVIQDIPVLIPTAGGWSMTFPIQPGDECLLIFNDQEIDSWLYSGGTKNNTISSRRHDLSDAIAIFGLRSTPNGLSNYSTTSTQIRNNDKSVLIDISTSNINIKAPTVTINASEFVEVNSPTITYTATSSISLLAPGVEINGSPISSTAGASGSFTAQSGNTITVQGGIITSIE